MQSCLAWLPNFAAVLDIIFLATQDSQGPVDGFGVAPVSPQLTKLQGPRGTWHQHTQDESL
jgi:hypothetical protein